MYQHICLNILCVCYIIQLILIEFLVNIYIYTDESMLMYIIFGIRLFRKNAVAKIKIWNVLLNNFFFNVVIMLNLKVSRLNLLFCLEYAM